MKIINKIKRYTISVLLGLLFIGVTYGLGYSIVTIASFFGKYLGYLFLLIVIIMFSYHIGKDVLKTIEEFKERKQ